MVTRSACDVTIYVTHHLTRFRSGISAAIDWVSIFPAPPFARLQLSYLAAEEASLKLTRL